MFFPPWIDRLCRRQVVDHDWERFLMRVVVLQHEQSLKNRNPLAEFWGKTPNGRGTDTTRQVSEALVAWLCFGFVRVLMFCSFAPG